MNKMGFLCKCQASSRGNIFAALFAGVLLIGLLGVAAMSYIRGPLTTMTNVTRIDNAKAQMQMAAQLSILAAANDPGDPPYARVFVASGAPMTGNLGGLAGADATCQARASAASLPGTYMAWLSTGASSPSTRFTQLSTPYRLVDGTLIANNWTDLTDGTIAANLNKTETGASAAGQSAWTGTLSDGTPNTFFPNYCNNWTDGTAGFTGVIGIADASGGTWSAQACCVPCNIGVKLYCFQQSATSGAPGGDCDSDTYVEPYGFKTTAGAKPTNGGLIPDEIAATKQDPWGNTYGYCAWNHGSNTSSTCGTNGANRLAGANAQTWTSIAIVSAGPDKTFQTTCSAFVDTTPADGNPDTALVAKTGGSDDVVFEYTYANAIGASGGLWKLKSGSTNVAELTSNTKTADVRLADQTALGASSCLGAGDLGRVRYDTVTAGLQVCNFVVTYDWRAISGGGGSTIDGLSDGIAEYTSLFNVFLGENAGAVTTAGPNTGVGANVLRANTTGVRNIAIGGGQNSTTDPASLRSNTTGSNNVGVGAATLVTNTTGSNNVAVGYAALAVNSTGNDSTAVGYAALNVNTASEITAFGLTALIGNTTGVGNTALGASALAGNTTGARNTGAGHAVLNLNATGNDNTAVGYNALQNNTASNNTAFGWSALTANTSGTNNTAVGLQALKSNTTGSYNTAIGHAALDLNTTGQNNTAIGLEALKANTTASDSVAIGAQALTSSTAANNTAVGTQASFRNTTGTFNTAFGHQALYENITNSNNTAFGSGALANNTADSNTAIGNSAMFYNTTGTNNVAAGYNALNSNTTGSNNVALGNSALGNNTTGSDNVAIGYIAGPSTSGLSNTIAIGNGASVTASNSVRVGDTAITTIEGQVAFTATSDRRLKKDMEPSDLGLDFVMGLKPVSYRMKNGNGKLDYGFIAQDVAALVGTHKTNMVFEDKDKDKTFKLRHTDIIAPVVKAIQIDEVQTQNLTDKLEAQQKMIARLSGDTLFDLRGLLTLCGGMLFGFVLVVVGRRLFGRQGGAA